MAATSKKIERVNVTKISWNRANSMSPYFKEFTHSYSPMPIDIAVFNMFDRFTDCAVKQNSWKFMLADNGGWYIAPDIEDQSLIEVFSPNGASEKITPEEAGMFATVVVITNFRWAVSEEALQRSYSRLCRLIGEQAHYGELIRLMD